MQLPLGSRLAADTIQIGTEKTESRELQLQLLLLFIIFISIIIILYTRSIVEYERAKKPPRAASLPSHDQRVSQQSVSECYIPSTYILYIHTYMFHVVAPA